MCAAPHHNHAHPSEPCFNLKFWLYSSLCCSAACGSWYLSVLLHMEHLNNYFIWYYIWYICVCFSPVAVLINNPFYCRIHMHTHTHTHRERDWNACARARTHTHTHTNNPSNCVISTCSVHYYCMLSFHSPYPAIQSQPPALLFLLSTSPAYSSASYTSPYNAPHILSLSDSAFQSRVRPGASVAERSAADIDACRYAGYSAGLLTGM